MNKTHIDEIKEEIVKLNNEYRQRQKNEYLGKSKFKKKGLTQSDEIRIFSKLKPLKAKLQTAELYEKKIDDAFEKLKEEDDNKPSFDNVIEYLKAQTFGSIRHAKISAIDVQQALHNLYTDLDNYWENKIDKIREEMK